MTGEPKGYGNCLYSKSYGVDYLTALTVDTISILIDTSKTNGYGNVQIYDGDVLNEETYYTKTGQTGYYKLCVEDFGT